MLFFVLIGGILVLLLISPLRAGGCSRVPDNSNGRDAAVCN